MTDIRTRLTDALRDHSEVPVAYEQQGFACVCDPSARRDLGEHWNHVADVLLSLPDIAIVDMTVWYITTDLLERGGKIVAGPFLSGEAAIEMREIIERGGRLTYWVDSQSLAVASAAEDTP